MSAASNALDLGRVLVDEQVALARRWSEASERYLEDLRQLGDGSLDETAFAREVAGLLAAETRDGAAAAVRVGSTYVRFMAELLTTAGRRAIAMPRTPER